MSCCASGFLRNKQIALSALWHTCSVLQHLYLIEQKFREASKKHENSVRKHLAAENGGNISEVQGDNPRKYPEDDKSEELMKKITASYQQYGLLLILSIQQ